MAKNTETLENDYVTPGWITLIATAIVMTLIFVFFTPYTHQLDEIKNVFLMIFPPFLLLSAVLQKDFSKVSWKSDSPTIFCGLWVVAMLCSYIVNPYKLTGERIVWFQMACLTFTLVFAWLMNTEDKMRKTMMFLTGLGFISVLFGLFFFAGRGFTDAIYNFMKSDPFWRRNYSEWITLFYTLKESRQMYSTILNEDFYGAFLVMTTAIPLAMFFVEKEHFWRRIFALGTFLLMNICLVFTNSNDSYSATILILYPMFFVLGALFVKREEWGLTRSIVLTFIIGALILAITIFVLQSPKIMQTWAFKSEALEGRKILWSGGLLPWLKGTDFNNPHFSPITAIFGTGPGGYRFYFPVWRNPFWFDNQINNVTTFGHNWYFDVLLEFGIFGLLSFLGMHIMVVVRALRQIAHTTVTTHKFYQMALVSGLCAVALQNFFSPNNRWAVAGMIYWSMFGLSMGLTMLDKPVDDKSKPSQKKMRFITGVKYAAIVVCLLFIVRSPWQGYWYWQAAKANAEGIRSMDIAGYRELGKSEQAKYLQLAKKQLTFAVNANPTFATSYYKLGHVLHSIGESDKAIETYEKLHTVFPYYSELNWNLSTMYFAKAFEDTTPEEQVKDMGKSWEHMRIAAQQSRKPAVQFRVYELGSAILKMYNSLGMTKEADAIRKDMKVALRNFIDYEPKLEEFIADKKENYDTAELGLLKICKETSDTQGSIDILRKMYFEHPDNTVNLNNLLAVYNQDNQTTAMLNFMKEAIDNAPLDPKLREAYAAVLDKADNKKESEEQLKRASILRQMLAVDTKATTATK